MRLVMIVFLFALGVSSCKFNPSQLADDYCSCLQRIEKGKAKEGECAEMAESHYLKLQDEDEALAKYTKYIEECLMFDDIRTNKDLREDRKQRRSRK